VGPSVALTTDSFYSSIKRSQLAAVSLSRKEHVPIESAATQSDKGLSGLVSLTQSHVIPIDCGPASIMNNSMGGFQSLLIPSRQILCNFSDSISHGQISFVDLDQY
jgi:hypothetical protein